MLSMRNLRFGYADKPILNIDKLTVKDGEHLLVRGASGTGKTSLLFLLAGLLAPQGGSIVVEDTDLATLDRKQRDVFRGQNIGFVFQQPHLMHALTVLQNVLVAPFMAGKKPERDYAVSLLQKLGLGDLLHRYPWQLSQGQMQRVGLARALVHKPKLILADEPTSALDDEAAQASIDLLLASARSVGAQVVVTSHDSRISRHFSQTLLLEART